MSDPRKRIAAMADPVAITSIVSGAAVAIGVPFINAQLEHRRIERQSQDARLEELRDLLDDAVQHLWTAWTIFYEIEQKLAEATFALRRSFRDSLTAITDIVVADNLRIALRTPPDSMLKVKHGEAQQTTEATAGFIDASQAFVGVVGPRPAKA